MLEEVKTTAVETVAGAAVAAGAASAVPIVPNSRVPDRTADTPAAANLLLIPLDKQPTSSFTLLLVRVIFTPTCVNVKRKMRKNRVLISSRAACVAITSGVEIHFAAAVTRSYPCGYA